MTYQWTENQIKRAKIRGCILFCTPVYPITKKGSQLKRDTEARTGPISQAAWNYWIQVLMRDKALIRRPGAQLCRPRSVADLAEHVAPWTKKRVVKVRKRVAPDMAGKYGPLAKQANEALKLQMKNFTIHPT